MNRKILCGILSVLMSFSITSCGNIEPKSLSMGIAPYELSKSEEETLPLF